MPTVTTERFGELNYDEGSVIAFPVGLPGFETETSFLLVPSETMKPLIFLQSMQRPGLCFTTIPVQLIHPDYELTVSEGDRRLLGWIGENAGESRTDLLCLGILCASDGSVPTVNLLGPILIDQVRRLGIQAVREDARYSAQHPLFAADRGDQTCL